MKQQKPIIHGRDHAPGGPDPIVGLAAGGALEWEDVGVSSPPVSPWARYAIVRGSQFVAAAGPETRVKWSTIETSYSPEGPLVDLEPAGTAPAGEHIRLLLSGYYNLNLRFSCFGGVVTGPPSVQWQINGELGFGNLGVIGVNTQWILQSGTSYYPYVDMHLQVVVAAAPKYFRFTGGSAAASWPAPDATALIQRLSPYG